MFYFDKTISSRNEELFAVKCRGINKNVRDSRDKEIRKRLREYFNI